jgi:hypothetical protein
MLPVPSGCEIDREEAQPTDNDPADVTSSDDGWALSSGTSAAAPQLAGAAALLAQTTVDVVVGHSFPQRFNNPATPGPILPLEPG